MAEHGPPRAWLTFDDGPHPTNTDLVLEALAGRKLHATFFMTGRAAYACPDVVRRVQEAGHRIGNHSYTHPHLSALPAEAIAMEILAAAALIEPNGPCRLLRPPYGDRSDTVAMVTSRLGYYFCLWNVDPDDWKDDLWVARAEAQITDRLADKTLTKNCILLLHDIHATTAAGLGSLVQMLGRLGVELQPPSTLPFDLIPTVPPRKSK